MISIGTSGTVVTATEETEPDFEGGVHLFRHVISNQSYYMGVMLSAAHSLNWAIKNFGITDDFITLEKKIKEIKPGADGLLFLPYLNGERTPHRDPDARGVLFGISSKTTQAEIVRAVIEGVTFGLQRFLRTHQGKNNDYKYKSCGRWGQEPNVVFDSRRQFQASRQHPRK